MLPGHHRAHTLLHFINKASLSGAEMSLVELASLDTKEFK